MKTDDLGRPVEMPIEADYEKVKAENPDWETFDKRKMNRMAKIAMSGRNFSDLADAIMGFRGERK